MSDAFAWSAVIVSAATTALSIAIALYLYRWRKIITAQGALFVPETLISNILHLRSDLKQQANIRNLSFEDSKYPAASVWAENAITNPNGLTLFG